MVSAATYRVLLLHPVAVLVLKLWRYAAKVPLATLPTGDIHLAAALNGEVGGRAAAATTAAVLHNAASVQSI